MIVLRKKTDSRKTRFSCLFAFSLLVAFAVHPGARANVVTEVNDHWGYWPNRLSYTGGNLRVDGCFFNHNPGYDIGEMTGLTLILCDADDREIGSFDVGIDAGLESIILPSNAAVDYSFTIPDCEIDASLYNFSSFRATIHCEYTYYNCRGAGTCSICAPWRPSVPAMPKPTREYDFIQAKCEKCDGKGSYPCILCEDGILYYETKRTIDIGGGSSTYEVPVYCRMCKNGRVGCTACGGEGWRWELDMHK